MLYINPEFSYAIACNQPGYVSDEVTDAMIDSVDSLAESGLVESAIEMAALAYVRNPTYWDTLACIGDLVEHCYVNGMTRREALRRFRKKVGQIRRDVETSRLLAKNTSES